MGHGVTGPSAAAARAVGEHLKRLRLRAGYTNSDVVTRLGLAPGQNPLWETGRGSLSTAELDRLLDLYRASPTERSAAGRLYDGSAVTDGVFISYRREDTRWFAALLYDRIADRIGATRTFRDVEKITLGVDFTQVLEDTLAGCRVLIAVIGPGWLCDDTGRRRLDDPDDWVRQEIEVGLTRDVFVIPLLVDGASLPPAEDLPRSLAPLTRRNHLRISSDARFEGDCATLLDHIEKILEP